MEHTHSRIKLPQCVCELVKLSLMRVKNRARSHDFQHLIRTGSVAAPHMDRMEDLDRPDPSLQRVEYGLD